MAGHVDDEEDTQPSVCARCAARSAVDAALVRAGVDRATLVIEYRRPSIGTGVVELVKAFLSLQSGRIARGDGHSREEALINALDAAGVST